MIEVLLHALGEREMRRVLVVVVLLEDGNVRFRERLDDPPGDGCFAGAGAAADADDQGLGDFVAPWCECGTVRSLAALRMTTKGNGDGKRRRQCFDSKAPRATPAHGAPFAALRMTTKGNGDNERQRRQQKASAVLRSKAPRATPAHGAPFASLQAAPVAAADFTRGLRGRADFLCDALDSITA